MTAPANVLLVGNFDGFNLESVFSGLDVSLTFAESLEQAVQAVSIASSSSFAAILFSPGASTVDGIAVARALRERADTPVVFMPDAANSNFPYQQVCELDGVDILAMPILPALLASKLRFYIDIFRRQENLIVNQVFQAPPLGNMRTDDALAEFIAESESRHRLYETVLSNTPDLVYVFDLDHRFSYANKVLLTMWGKTWSEAIGKNCLELGYEPWHAEMHDREIEQVKSTKQPIRGEVAFDGAFGRRIYDYIFTPVIGSNGEVEAIAGSTRDITESSEIREALKANKQALQMEDRRKDEFLAMLAHELRNPLAPISAAAQIMLLGELDEQRVRKSSQIIERQVRHMVTLVDDLLDVSRVTRGLVSIDQAEQDIKLVIQYSIEQVRPLLEARRHHLDVELTAESTYVMGDRDRLVQVMSNLLNNATKYTPDGGHIAISLIVQDGNAVITITDNGIGIAIEEQSHIYDLFAQAKRSSDRSQGGLGLGLALVKSMVDLHHGEVRCYSAGIGSGSSFTVSLPLIQARQASHSIDSSQPAPCVDKKLKVLVVDDNVDAALTLASFLELNGHDVVVEHEARRALERALADRPQVCILDIGLPDMDGKELARNIRAQAGTAETKLIAVTGYGQEHDRNAALEAGFDHHMVKPVDVIKLSNLIAGISDS